MLQAQADLRITYSLTHPCRVITRLTQFLKGSFFEQIDLDDLASAAMTDKYRLCRRFRQRYGLTPVRWLWRTRIHVASQLIERNPRWSLTDIAFACGFSSSAHFSRAFKQELGASPSQFRDFWLGQSKDRSNHFKGSLADYFYESEPLIAKAIRRALTSPRAASYPRPSLKQELQ